MSAISKFGLFPATMIIILSVGLVNHVFIVPLLLNTALRDSWMCAFISLFLGLIWALFPVYGTMKRMNEPFTVFLDRALTPWGAWFIKGPLILLLFFITCNTFFDTISWATSTYLVHTPYWAITIVFILLVLYTIFSGLRTIAFTSAILLPFVIVLGDFVMTANLPHKDYTYLLPMFENGVEPVIKGGFLAACSMGELYTLVLFQHHLKSRFKLKHVLIIVVLLGLLTLGPLTGAVTQFGPFEAAKLRYPAFSQWRLVEIGKYIEHVDFFAIYQWLSGAFIRISLSMYLIMELLPFKKPVITKSTMGGIGVIIVVLTQIACDRMILYRQWVKPFFIYSGALILIISLIVWIASIIMQRKEALSRAGS
ncbi:spore germination protein (amino acid permease) [Paenibacillus shirakamiensis]|uniref:Spore germination protein (Amino acid permease) n=1 Tax=Paenibacillus shirakamiensis TaxID=1265935 RepID=A0ABS4JIC2_9BACL|nr:endospore germination permease [Paenibacillus shirakamiensis]MBP2000309.1 spore germination protein (amino acid permease) [Paenibacillus shirakamiensis]